MDTLLIFYRYRVVLQIFNNGLAKVRDIKRYLAVPYKNKIKGIINEFGACYLFTEV